MVATGRLLAVSLLGWLFAIGFLALSLANVGSADEGPAETAAVVNGQVITVADVDALVKKAFRGRKIQPAALAAIQAQTLSQLIDRRLVAGHLDTQGISVDAKQVDASIVQFKKQLELQKLSFDDFLKKDGLTAEMLRRKVAWQMNWRRYTAKTLTDAALSEFFQQHRRALDGSQVKVSHLLLQVNGPATPDQAARLRGQTALLRERIVSGDLSFAGAVSQFSQGTKKAGGDLGFIARGGAMPEPFAKAAFALEKGEISAPVTTPFGVHLILCVDIKPGNKKLADVRKKVRLQAAAAAFAKIAQAQRAKAKIEFTGKSPYFRPSGGELVTPR